MINEVSGFFAGKRAFSLIAKKVGEEDSTRLKEIIYNGFSIKLDSALGESDVVGIGEPYATIAKKMKEHFDK